MATQMQIDWAKTAETKRHNKATERQARNELAETSRHNVSTESISRGTLAEQYRHNYQTELISKQDANTRSAQMLENVRHNLMTESLGYDTLGETKRHNVVGETLGYGQLDYSYDNLGYLYASLGETARHNKASEGIDFIRARAQETSAAAAQSQAVTAQNRIVLDRQKFARQITTEDRQYGMDLVYGGVRAGSSLIDAIIPN